MAVDQNLKVCQTGDSCLSYEKRSQRAKKYCQHSQKQDLCRWEQTKAAWHNEQRDGWATPRYGMLANRAAQTALGYSNRIIHSQLHVCKLL
jgi:hypothetical protein